MNRLCRHFTAKRWQQSTVCQSYVNRTRETSFHDSFWRGATKHFTWFLLLLRDIFKGYMQGGNFGARGARRWRVCEAWQEMSHASESITTWGLGSVACRCVDTYEIERKKKGETEGERDREREAAHENIEPLKKYCPLRDARTRLWYETCKQAMNRCDQTKKCAKKFGARDTPVQLIQACVMRVSRKTW